MLDLKTLELPRPLLIAEIGGNHEGDIDRAHQLARAAADNGADVVKFQTYRAEGLVNPKLSPERSAHFRRLELPLSEWEKLAKVVTGRGAHWMTSLWDDEAFDVIEPLQPAFKVGSGDLTNFPLLRRMVATGKPLILSSAMSTAVEVMRTVGFLLGCDGNLLADRRLGLLQCTALYDQPASLETNLAVMTSYSAMFPGVVVGYSNHYVGLDACYAALALGARIIEVHMTDDRTLPFRDHRLSVLPEELGRLRELCEIVPRLVGSDTKQVAEVEVGLVREFRRAVYLRRDVATGELITAEDLVTLRPEVGIPAWRFDEVVGRRAKTDLEALSPLSFDKLAP